MLEQLQQENGGKCIIEILIGNNGQKKNNAIFSENSIIIIH
jgi:hypothetical protein